jgi:TRAP-type C4-dicarboxylate transport system substrate-binding protein
MRGLGALLLLCGNVALAAPVLRIATIVPDGTPWARELRTWADGVEKSTDGQVAVKLILGGVAGDDLQVDERIHRGQLDGVISFGTLCQKAAPSMGVLRVPALFQTRDEAVYVMGQLKARFDREARANGYVNLADGGAGSIIVFSRKPVASLADLRALKLWTGRQDEVQLTALTALGLKVLAEPMSQAGADYQKGGLDGFLAVPSAALSWQWAKQTPYFTDLKVAFLSSCLLVSNASFDALPSEAQELMRAAAAQLLKRSEEMGRQADDALVGKLFEKQGLKRVKVDDRFRAEFDEAAHAVRDQLPASLVSHDLLREILSLLADYRALRK